MQLLIKDYPSGPYIDRVGISVEFRLLWCNVLFGACNSFHNDVFRAKFEISDFEIRSGSSLFVLFGQQNVLRF
jgi:hypothetical protein